MHSFEFRAWALALGSAQRVAANEASNSGPLCTLSKRVLQGFRWRLPSATGIHNVMPVFRSQMGSILGFLLKDLI